MILTWFFLYFPKNPLVHMYMPPDLLHSVMIEPCHDPAVELTAFDEDDTLSLDASIRKPGIGNQDGDIPFPPFHRSKQAKRP